MQNIIMNIIFTAHNSCDNIENFNVIILITLEYHKSKDSL